MSVQIALCRSILRVIRQYDKVRIPLLSVVGSDITDIPTTLLFKPAQACKFIFRNQNSDNVEDGFRVLRSLNLQLHHLNESEEQTKQALEEWWQLLQQYQQMECGAVEQTQLVEQAMRNIHWQTLPQDSLFEDEVEEQKKELEQNLLEFQHTLQELCKQVTEISNQNKTDNDQFMKDLQQIFFGEYKFRTPPFEWVYEGFAPLMLADVVKNRKGSSFSVGLVIWLVCNRCGIECVMRRIQHASQLNVRTDEMASAMENLPVHVAAKHIGRSLQAAPEPGPWILQFKLNHTQMFMDPQDNGRIYSEEQLLEKYGFVGDCIDGWFQSLQILKEACRLMIMGHTRRGESDMVASWLYQLMSLDSNAQQWQHVLQTVPIRK